MIIKVQIPIMTNEEIPLALAYNKDRSFTMQFPLKKELKWLMGNEYKIYCHAKLKNGNLVFGNKLKTKDQDW